MEASAPPQDKSAEKRRTLTKYHVLVQAEEGVWTAVGQIAAVNSGAAIKKAAAGREGVYVAVPYRSWQPRTLKVEQQTVVKLG